MPAHLNRREWLQTGMAGVGAAAILARADARAAIQPGLTFHWDSVLGTSLDGWVVADPAAAEAAAITVFDRLNRVFSLHDPESDLSRFNRDRNASVSPEFHQVLQRYPYWTLVTRGALHPATEPLHQLWRDAERRNQLPRPDELQAARSRIEDPMGNPDFNLNSIAKGFILQQAAESTRRISPDGGYLNLGGDCCVWGRRPFAVGITDPFAPSDNAMPMTAVCLSNGSLATSGGYLRGYSVQGRHYSHLIDPRTGWPAEVVAQATVAAADSPTANALATALCLMAPDDGLDLINRIDGTECLMVLRTGAVLRSHGWAAMELALETSPVTTLSRADGWPQDFQVTMGIELPKMAGGRYRRPYLAAWIENSDGKLIRTVAVWGNAPKWIPELSGWWKLVKNDRDYVKTVTKATRQPGKYDLVWDGKDDKGNAVPQGTYTVKIEVHREHGKHLTQTGKIACLGESSQTTLEKNAESEAVKIAYARKPASVPPVKP